MDASTDDSKDYLIDPELWLDKLPQPFQMIDEVLQEFVDEVWEVIESRAVIREQERARVNIPDITGGQPLSKSEGTVVMSCHGDGPLFLGSPSGLSVWEHCCDSFERRVGQEWGAVPTGLITGESQSVNLVAVTFEKNIKVFGYSKEHLIPLTDIFLGDEQDTKVTHCTTSPTWSHLTVSTTHPDEGGRLKLYKLPLSSWHSEIETYLQQHSLEGEGSQSQVSIGSRGSKQQQEDMVFSTATLLYTVQPPGPLTPSTATDPASGMQRVLDSTPGSCVPTGDLHILNEQHLNNRRRAFVSQRVDFVQESRDPLSYTHSLPTYHYLYYKDFCRQASPCLLAVWWEKHNQLLMYPIPDSPSKLLPPPVRLLPQTAAIVSSASDVEGLHLAMATADGVASLWNTRTALCVKVERVVESSSDRVTVMAFTERADHLVVGSETGRVLVIDTKSPHQGPTSLQDRVSQQKAVYPHLFEHSGYKVESKVVDLKFNTYLPSVVVSVHATGTVVLWSMTECEALCKISPTHCPSLRRPHSCTLAKRSLLVIGESTEAESTNSLTNALVYDLHTTPTLTPHWTTPSTASHAKEPSAIDSGMTSSIKNYLSLYTRARHASYKTDRERWQKRWSELPQVLNSLSVSVQ